MLINLKHICEKINPLFFLIFLCLLTIAVFSPILSNGFTNWDDPEYLLTNEAVRNLSWENVHAFFTDHLSGKYHPLTLLSLSVEHRLFGLRPFGYHLVSLLLHIINIILVFTFIRLLTSRNEVVMITTFLFALHPFAVEPVAWVTSRKDLLFAMFFLSSLICYIYFVRDKVKYSQNYVFVLILFILSVLCKATAVALPLILICLDYYFKRGVSRQTVLEKIPFFLVACFLGLISFSAVKGIDAFPVTKQYALYERFFLSGSALLIYLQKLIIPVGFSSFYGLPPRDAGQFAAIVYLSPCILFLILLLIFRRRKANRVWLFGFLFFLIMVAPVLHLLVVNDSIIYDRFMYLSGIGIFFMVAYYLSNLMAPSEDRKKQFCQKIITILVIFFLMNICALSWSRCHVWRNSNTLWTDVIERYPISPVAYFNRGSYFAEQNNFDRALIDINKAIELRPNYISAYFNRGNIRIRSRQYELAIADYNQALTFDDENIEVLNNRANLYFILGKEDKAIDDYSEVLVIDPEHITSILNRGMVYFHQEKYEDALADFERILLLEPQHRAAKAKKKEILDLLFSSQ